jgi:hypothetical protein
MTCLKCTPKDYSSFLFSLISQDNDRPRFEPPLIAHFDY